MIACRLAAVMLALMGPTAASGQFYPGGSINGGPNGNGTLNHQDDLRWTMFHEAKVVADRARGRYEASFPPTLAKADGRPLTITDYMLSIDMSPVTKHFILTRHSATCPFCPPNEPMEAIEVFAATPIFQTDAPLKVSGTLRLIGHSDRGLFFRLDGATSE